MCRVAERRCSLTLQHKDVALHAAHCMPAVCWPIASRLSAHSFPRGYRCLHREAHALEQPLARLLDMGPHDLFCKCLYPWEQFTMPAGPDQACVSLTVPLRMSNVEPCCLSTRALVDRLLFCCGTVQAAANALGGPAVQHARVWRSSHQQLWSSVTESCQGVPASTLSAAIAAFDSGKADRGAHAVMIPWPFTPQMSAASSAEIGRAHV